MKDPWSDGTIRVRMACLTEQTTDNRKFLDEGVIKKR